MIEGLVMEVHKSYVIVLSPGGEYLKLKKFGNVSVGDIYTGKEYKIFMPRYAAAAVMLFFMTAFGGYTAYANQIVGVVNISGTKDVKLYISRNGYVKKVEGLDDASSLKNIPVDKAVEQVNNIGKKEGAFNEGETVKVNTTKIKSSKINLDDVKNKVETEVNKNSSKKPNPNPPQKNEETKDLENNNTKNDNKKDIKNDDKNESKDIKKLNNSNNINSSKNSPPSNSSSKNKNDKPEDTNEKQSDNKDKEKNDKNKYKKK
jgi:hypothetical protein